jgi:hypothetical protein
MDELTTAVTLVTLDSPELAEQWFLTIGQTYDEVAESDDVWAEFAERFPMAAESYFGSSTATQWLEGIRDLTSDPAGLLGLMAQRRDELASIYWAELQEREAAWSAGSAEEASYDSADPSAYAAVEEADASGDPFAWVHAQPELAMRVESILQYRPEHYESHLGPYLEQIWGAGWEQHPDEHKQAWLGQALDGMEASGYGQAPAEAGPGESAGTAETAETAEGQGADAELAEVEQQVADALAEALAEVPEAAALSDEEIAEVLAEVLAEQAATAESV